MRSSNGSSRGSSHDRKSAFTESNPDAATSPKAAFSNLILSKGSIKHRT